MRKGCHLFILSQIIRDAPYLLRPLQRGPTSTLALAGGVPGGVSLVRCSRRSASLRSSAAWAWRASAASRVRLYRFASSSPFSLSISSPWTVSIRRCHLRSANYPAKRARRPRKPNTRGGERRQLRRTTEPPPIPFLYRISLWGPTAPCAVGRTPPRYCLRAGAV